MNIYKIVFPGGPCAGKTTVIDEVKNKLVNDGYYVVVVPETASELIRSGILPNNDRAHTLKFQELILKTQARKERIAEEYCESIQKSNIDLIRNKKGIVILYDRGIMDNRAYLTHEDYNNMLKKYNYNELEIIDKYDLVINLISTATAKPEAYCLNGVRYESVEEAAYRDQLTSGAWLLHKNLKMIKPTDHINEKVAIVLNHIYGLLKNKCENETIEFEVDLENTDFSCYNNDNSRRIKVKRFCLQTSNNEYFILEKRQYNNNVSFIMEKFRLTIDCLSLVERRSIKYADYVELLATTSIKQIEEIEYLHFVNQGNYFTLAKDNFGTKLYTNSSNISQIPENIVLKKEKTFTK